MPVSIVYEFTSPSGKKYIGKHTCEHAESMPAFGNGPLACCGYQGGGIDRPNHLRKGQTPWHKAVRHYGDQLLWRVVHRCQNETDAFAFEKWYIAFLRRIGYRLYNLTEGGDGFTSEHKRAYFTDPANRERVRRCVKNWFADPINLEKHRTRMRSTSYKENAKKALHKSVRTRCDTTMTRYKEDGTFEARKYARKLLIQGAHRSKISKITGLTYHQVRNEDTRILRATKAGWGEYLAQY